MKLFIYGVFTSLGILGLSGHFLAQYQYELFFGWLGPVVAGTTTIIFIKRASRKEIRLITKTLTIGFAIKMIFYGAYILILFKIYPFNPIPLMCSFAGFFLGLHALEAVIINNLSKSEKLNY
ncbi:MAG: hypothetical protein VX600_01815 [Candidatus Neomarinimicrobiota bacterium]|jgi:hypothetical protein|nr:hypothetical protein [Candidatus Neomarinimicrobiota bacterium]|tara:strand:+ start:214 stop:579 length:366 start_codon:yes stop_codon:yes gene_type:complete